MRKSPVGDFQRVAPEQPPRGVEPSRDQNEQGARAALELLPRWADSAGVVVVTPPPPSQLDDRPEHAARQLAGWALALVGAESGGRTHWALAALRGKARKQVDAAVKALADAGVPPVDFLWWQMACWRGMHADKAAKDRPLPPVGWLFAQKRIDAACDVDFSQSYTHHGLTPLGRKYLVLREVAQVRGVKSTAEVDAMREALVAARAETKREQAKVDEAVAAGKWVWR